MISKKKNQKFRKIKKHEQNEPTRKEIFFFEFLTNILKYFLWCEISKLLQIFFFSLRQAYISNFV